MPERLNGIALAATPAGVALGEDPFALESFSVMSACARFADDVEVKVG